MFISFQPNHPIKLMYSQWIGIPANFDYSSEMRLNVSYIGKTQFSSIWDWKEWGWSRRSRCHSCMQPYFIIFSWRRCIFRRYTKYECKYCLPVAFWIQIKNNKYKPNCNELTEIAYSTSAINGNYFYWLVTSQFLTMRMAKAMAMRHCSDCESCIRFC